jgi:hypothetical protein
MPNIKDLRLSLTDICWVLGLTKQRVQQLEADGIVEKVDRNSYRMASVPKYLKLIREAGRGPKKWQDARTELVLERLRMAKLDRLERQNELIPAADIIKFNAALCNVFKTALMGLGNKLGPQVANSRDPARAAQIITQAHIELLTEFQRLTRIVDERKQGN